jgi:hypothetical protein
MRKTVLVLRCFGAIVAGNVMFAACIALLALFGASPEPPAHTATQTLSFPQDEEALERMAEALTEEGLSRLAPAAGE